MKQNPVIVIITLVALVFLFMNWSDSTLFGVFIFLAIIGKCCNGYEDRKRRNKWWN